MPIANPTSIEDRRCQITATIADGTATTGEIDLGGMVLVGILFPASMTQTTMTFTMAPASGGTYVAIQDTTPASISITFASSKYIALNAVQQAQFAGARFIKCVAGGNETGAKILTLITKPV